MIIVGAGVGGLVSAALLAARGCAVTVVEAQEGPGGKLRAIDGIDAGPTVFTLRDVFDRVFDECGWSLEEALVELAEGMKRPPTSAGRAEGVAPGTHTSAVRAERVEALPFPPITVQEDNRTSASPAPADGRILRAHILARHAWGDTRLDLFADPAESEDAIGVFAGAVEARGFRAFRAEAKRLYDALDRPFLQGGKADPLTLGWRMGIGGLRDYATLHPYTSLWTRLGRYFRDSRLRQLFGRYATYCGSDPFRTPATLMLIAHVEAAGVWLIDGGMHRLAAALEALGRRQGVTFRYGARVRRILTAHGRTAGVELDGGERIAGSAVICNADPAALGAGRFGVRAGAALPPAKRSLSALVWLSETRAAGFPLERHNVVFSPDYRAEFDDLRGGRLPADPSVYLCAQDRGHGAAPGGSERVQIIVNAPATADTRPLDPQEIRTCTQAMRARLAASGLALDLPAQATRLLTPADFEALNPATGGALYGRASHGWAASFLRQGSRTRIPGLYCAGGSTHPGAGVPMAALSGRLAAECWLRDRASTSSWGRRAMPGGTSTPSATTAATA